MTDRVEEQAKKVPVLRTDNSLIQDEFDSIRSRFDEEMRIIEQEMARFKSQMNMSLGSKLLANSNETNDNKFVGKMTTAAAEAATASSSSTKTTKTTTTKTTSLTNKTINKRIGEERPQRPVGSKGTSTESTFEPNHNSNPNQNDRRHHHPERSTTRGSEMVDEGSKRASDLGEGENGDQAQCIDSPLIVNNSRVAGGKMLKLRFDVSSYEPDQIVVATIDNRLQVHAKRNDVSANKSTFSEYNREFLLPAGTNPDTIKSTLSADGVLTVEVPLATKM